MPIYSDVPNTSIVQMAGVRYAQYAVCDVDGYPNGPAGSLANGAQRGMGLHVGVKRAGGQAPENRSSDATGDDGSYQMAFLYGPNATGRLNLSFAPYNMDFLTAVTGTKIQTSDEWNMVGEETNADPNSATICLLFNIFSREADTDMGKARWTNLFYPLVAVAPRYAEHQEVAVAEWPYIGVPARAAKTPWGVAFTKGINGFTRAARIRRTSRYPLTMSTLIGNASATVINLDYTPSSDDTGFTVKVYTDGIELTKTTQWTCNPGLKKVTLAVAPAIATRTIVLYEAIDIP